MVQSTQPLTHNVVHLELVPSSAWVMRALESSASGLLLYSTFTVTSSGTFLAGATTFLLLGFGVFGTYTASLPQVGSTAGHTFYTRVTTPHGLTIASVVAPVGI